MDHVWACLVKLDRTHTSQATEIACLRLVNERMEADLVRKSRRKRELKRLLGELKRENADLRRGPTLQVEQLRSELTQSKQKFDALCQNTMQTIRERDDALKRCDEETQKRKRLRSTYRLLEKSLDGTSNPQISQALREFQETLK